MKKIAACIAVIAVAVVLSLTTVLAGSHNVTKNQPKAQSTAVYDHQNCQQGDNCPDPDNCPARSHHTEGARGANGHKNNVPSNNGQGGKHHSEPHNEKANHQNGQHKGGH